MVQGTKSFTVCVLGPSEFRALEVLAGRFLQGWGCRSQGGVFFSVWVRTPLVMGRFLPSKNARTIFMPICDESCSKVPPKSG